MTRPRPGRGEGIDWALLFRAAEQRLKLRKWEIGRYTLSQLANALDSTDPSDPHAGGIPIDSATQLDRLIEELE